MLPGVLYALNLPKFVNAFDVRSSFNKGPWSVLAEYAWKGQDPSFDNNYTYRHGSAVTLLAALTPRRRKRAYAGQAQ